MLYAVHVDMNSSCSKRCTVHELRFTAWSRLRLMQRIGVGAMPRDSRVSTMAVKEQCEDSAVSSEPFSREVAGDAR